MTTDRMGKVADAVNILQNFGEQNKEMTVLLDLARAYLNGELVEIPKAPRFVKTNINKWCVENPIGEEDYI